MDNSVCIASCYLSLRRFTIRRSDPYGFVHMYLIYEGIIMLEAVR